MKLLQGQPIAEKIEQEEILPNLQQLKSDRPHLAIILVGDDTDSEVYVRQKEKTGKNLGISVLVYRLDKNISLAQINKTINLLNQDNKISGIIIQLPLPKKLKFSTQKLLDQIEPAKDVDMLSSNSLSSKFSFSSFNELKSAYRANHRFLPPTAIAVLEIINYYQIPLKNILIIGRGILVGAPIAKMFNQMKLKYQVIHSQTLDSIQKNLLKNADLIITGSSSPKPIISASNSKSNAVIIDCAHDFDHNDISSWSGSVTPIIGGIGPVTVACLLRNVVLAKLWQNQNSKSQIPNTKQIRS